MRKQGSDARLGGCAMRVTEEQSDMIAHLDGALDAASVPSIRDALLTLTQTALQAGWLIVDLSSVTALDRQGANLLAALSRRAYAADIRLRLRAPSCHLRAVMAAAAARPFLRS